jgi:two-component SAPR family response regulator
MQPISTDAACFLQGGDPLAAMLSAWRRAVATPVAHAVLVAEPGAPLHAAWRHSADPPPATALTPGFLGLLEKPFSTARITARLSQQLGAEGRAADQTVLLVDMDWLLRAPSAMANGAIWGSIIERVLAGGAAACLSLYHRRHLPERDLLAGLHAHAAVLAPDGCHVNPYRLPLELTASASGAQAMRLRFDHWLGHLSPALRWQAPARAERDLQAAAPLSGGEAPSVLPAREEQGSDSLDDAAAGAVIHRWKIRCLGSLRVYRRDGQAVQWHGSSGAGKAGATRKVRGLFALLLMSGERGMDTGELVDTLWPDTKDPDKVRNRLHHTVTELRRSLAPLDAAGRPPEKISRSPYVVREAQRYYLRPPPNSWIDVEEFPQLCRQGGDLLRDGRLDEALLCFDSALKLYTGDLFEDLPASLTDDGDADWCAATRAWLRELCVKVHGDCARIHRELGNPLQAAAHCRELLRHDASSSFAHAELMRLHAAQGRREALDRQFQVYRQALPATGHADGESIPLMGLYVELMRQLTQVKTPRDRRP